MFGSVFGCIVDRFASHNGSDDSSSADVSFSGNGTSFEDDAPKRELISCNETNDVSLLKSSASSQLNFFDG
jgi:hypothetical protein